jgi:galactokinase
MPHSIKTLGNFPANWRIASGIAPGTVNLLGSHTCYNHGFALAIATPQKTQVEVCESPDDLNHFCSVNPDKTVTCSTQEHMEEGFSLSLLGCLMVLQELQFPLTPVCALVRSDLPSGAGLSDNAALQVAMLRALGGLFGFRMEDMHLARMAQRVDRDYSGITCGLIEQMASSFGETEKMLFLDSRAYEFHFLPLPDSSELVVVDSGVPSSFVDWYLVRRGECEEACRRLAVPALRDVTDLKDLSSLPQLLQQRARHIVTENARVLEAAGGVSSRRLGELMNESQASLRDDYEVSNPSLDLLAELFLNDSRTYGVRITGAGFGGACAALVEKGTAQEVAGEVLARYRERGMNGRVLSP